MGHMKWLLPFALVAIATAEPVDEFISAAASEHGAFGEKAARFLVEHMPEKDRDTLSADFLIENLDLALKARAVFPWARDVPEDLFLNDVLPYAVFDEARDPWRADFFEKCAPLVKDAATASEAAQLLNREFFDLIGTHYDTRRSKTNQSPKESMAQGKATCTGLSILLVDACRAVGIPARAVGTPMWSNGRGNHTWVEIWDEGWRFTGADEYDEAGLNRGWFTADAAQAKADDSEHAIYATSWRRDGIHFPMVWSPGSKTVAAVNVTHRYAKNTDVRPQLGVRLFSDGERMAGKGWLTSANGRRLAEFTTKAGTTDLNDMPRLAVTAGERYRLSFDDHGETPPFIAAAGENTHDARLAELTQPPAAVLALAADPLADPSLSAADAERVISLLSEIELEKSRAARAAELEKRGISLDGTTLRWLEKDFGEAESGGRSLWISMHGGGGAPTEVNDQQWRNQIDLYEPEEGIYVAPRAPTDTWNLWHQDHIDPLFSRLIESMIALRGVHPNKVYLMGYSAGGDGVWQLAPRMADRFAAAAMMAGHPNEASLLPLRNLPFAIFMGGEDAAYDRNKIAAERVAELGRLRASDPQGYVHLARIYEGLGHWMDRRDAEALPWMAKFERDPWPRKIVWVQDDVTHRRFYWLQLPGNYAPQAGERIDASVDGQTIHLSESTPPGTVLLLHDDLLDLDRPVRIEWRGRTFERKPKRHADVIRRALASRLDPASCPTAEVTVE